MYAREENGTIKIYHALPTSYVFTKDAPEEEIEVLEEVVRVEENGTQFREMQMVRKNFRPFEIGMSTGNFNLLPQEVIKREGFLPLENNPPPYDHETQVLEEDGYTVNEDSIVTNYRVIDLPEEVIAGKQTAKVDALRAQKKAAVDEIREEKINGGFIWNGKAYDTNHRSLLNIAAMGASIALNQPLPEGFVWRAADNSYTPMTVQDVNDFTLAARNFVNRTYAASWMHKDNLDQLTTLQDVQDYNINEGW